MKYSANNKIVYEAGDWVTIDNLIGEMNGKIGATFCVKSFDEEYVYGNWDITSHIIGGCWYPKNLRPATQEEIDKVLDNKKIMVGNNEVKFFYDANNVANSIKVGCQEVLKETFMKIGKKAGWI